MASSPFSEIVDSIIGRPFQWRAAGPDEFDCIGLIRYLAKKKWDIDLPEVKGPNGEKACRKWMESFTVLPNLGDLRQGDLIVQIRNGVNDHCYMVEDETWVVHCERGRNVLRSRISELPHGILEAYRMNLLCST